MGSLEKLALKTYPIRWGYREEIDWGGPYSNGPFKYKERYDANEEKRQAFITGYKLSQKNTINRICECLKKKGYVVDTNDLREALKG